MRQLFLGLMLSFSVLLSGLILLEFASRWLYHVEPAVRYYTEEGVHTTIGTKDPLRMKPGQFRQVASEFDVTVTIDRFGNRKSTSDGAPKVIFLGDSFTFGQGLNDSETFANIYCLARGLSCANLARSGSGTLEQADILDHYLSSEKWRPKKIMLFILAMTGSLMEGNDLKDNLNYFRDQTAASQVPVAVPGTNTPVTAEQDTAPTGQFSFRRELLIRSNLARIGYFFFAPFLRSSFSPKSDSTEVSDALALTKAAIEKIARLANKIGASIQIFVIPPMQDLARGSHMSTTQALREIVPDHIKLTSTGPTLLRNFGSAYYSFDGHLNAVGSKRIGTYLLDVIGEDDK
jgi:hypothetical protein